VQLMLAQGRGPPEYRLAPDGRARYDPVARCQTRRTAMDRDRDAEASF
jgi:hypothetical protein